MDLLAISHHSLMTGDVDQQQTNHYVIQTYGHPAIVI